MKLDVKPRRLGVVVKNAQTYVLAMSGDPVAVVPQPAHKNDARNGSDQVALDPAQVSLNRVDRLTDLPPVQLDLAECTAKVNGLPYENGKIGNTVAQGSSANTCYRTNSRELC